jgi:DNA-directed RNA polymerase subunit beta
MAHNMAQTFTGRKRIRKFFGHLREAVEMPNLIEVQKGIL